MKREHDVVVTSTASHPDGDGWPYYYCVTCPGSPHICAMTFDRKEGFDDEGWGKAAAEFNAAHPHTEVREAVWAQ